jgi:hypothetical protein
MPHYYTSYPRLDCADFSHTGVCGTDVTVQVSASGYMGPCFDVGERFGECPRAFCGPGLMSTQSSTAATRAPLLPPCTWVGSRRACGCARACASEYARALLVFAGPWWYQPCDGAPPYTPGTTIPQCIVRSSQCIKGIAIVSV